MLVATRDYVQTRWATRELLERDLPARPPAGEYAVRVVYGDTDSVFIRFSGIAYDDVCELGELMAARITRDLFRPPIKLECEKTFRRLLLITKKKYIGVINGGKMLMKGVDLVRKNNCAFINRRYMRATGLGALALLIAACRLIARRLRETRANLKGSARRFNVDLFQVRLILG